MKVIVGLGNPGIRYRRTRHNLGFMVVGEVARLRGIRLHRGRFHSTWGEGRVGREQVLLVRPQTFMNLSGRCVAPLLRHLGGGPEDLLVICDDVHLDLSRLRLRRAGSAGGHQGLASITRELGRSDFPRLRLGVGQPPEGVDMMSYVLGAFRRGEWPLAEEMIGRAAQAAEAWVYYGLEEAMNRFNQAASSV